MIGSEAGVSFICPSGDLILLANVNKNEKPFCFVGKGGKNRENESEQDVFLSKSMMHVFF